ncbi:nucleotidyltransferase family protein [Lactococcus insecticola]|uniref:Nucleotidyltransferase n=1 Tax=Pseudolactococcus insecticola TaxID=2709158 RepID=A0A6A0B5X8_9LACT|nr:nucleotidyltransferase domain-containing protein [Lactococcus insecticola]GFH40839.1 nucleotidyltransferase [Lactococcus insecticola]
MTVLTIDEIKEKVKPIAQKYNIPKVYLFGSYARNKPTENSDIDLVIDSSNILDYDILFDIKEELEEELKHHVDIIEFEVLKNNNTAKRKDFNFNVTKEMMGIL